MKMFIEEFAICGLLPLFFFGGIACSVVGLIYLFVPNIEDILERHGFCVVFPDRNEKHSETEKIPAYAMHKQEFNGIYANGKFENPITDYSTAKKQLQEV